MKNFDSDKFIVLNKKHIEDLNALHRGGYFDSAVEVLQLKNALTHFIDAYEEEVGKPLNQKYLVCNQDEPYALFVKALILDGFVTPEQFEKSTGQKYPAKAPVWYTEADFVWKLRPYGEALQDYIRRDTDSLYTYMVCAIGYRIPEDGNIPGCCEKQWFAGD
jgi:hypothetical protein